MAQGIFRLKLVRKLSMVGGLGNITLCFGISSETNVQQEGRISGFAQPQRQVQCALKQPLGLRLASWQQPEDFQPCLLVCR